ncbi:response regulator transcription factor [Altererythrobacter sp. B11]|uniref:response regulator transcription factor n=1 Tax=Altererythrobacter sp. B11 TaxID=2060312 RepID=UPI00155903DD|nr:LuxR C-terminal-related transcriptional regulator [Altererythrobacter sp. B11]
MFADSGWQITPAEHYEEIDIVPVSGGVVLCFIESGRDVERVQAHMSLKGHWLPIISCSDKHDTTLAVQAMQADAQGHLSWPFTVAEFTAMLTRIEARMDAFVRRQNARSLARKRLQPLSPRERDVLGALARLGSNKKIALELDLSPRTVEIYRSKIMQRLRVDHIAQALWLAFQSGEFVAYETADAVGDGAFPEELQEG